MKAIIAFLVGIYLTRAVMNALAFNQCRERKLKLRKALEQFIQANLPNLTTAEIQSYVNTLTEVN